MFLNDGNTHQQGGRQMTPTTNNARVAETTPTAGTAAAEQMLRDVAYVLRLTRRVKDEMMADRAPAAATPTRKAEGVLVA
jgi:hypothetical protein